MNETKEYRSINQSAVDAAINIESEDRLIKESVLLRNCLVPSSEIDCSYERKDVFIRDGLIEQIVDAQTFDLLKERERDQLAADTDRTHAKVLEIDCTDRMITPGLVNGHTHSVEHWLRGAIPPLPLEMWIFQLILNEPRGERGWFKERSWMETPSAMIAISALLCGIETLLSGSTVIMDHLLCRNLEDVEAAVTAYKALGIRCFIAPMLNDDATMYHNYVPLARDGDLRQMKCQGCGCCGGLDKNGCFRTKKSEYSLEGRASMLKLWEDAVKKFHDPENGVNIAIGPVTCFSASYGMLEGAAELRRKYNLCGHIHLLETRAQALQSKQFLEEHGGSSVKLLEKTGFLQCPGTSLAHGVWLTDEECEIVSKANATIVHNPLSNLRLGSGVAPLRRYKNNGVKVCLGADGSCSSDGQDMLEVVKIANFLPCVETPDYKDWPSPRETYLKLGCENGYNSVNLGQKGGAIREGYLADICLWDLTSLALLPKTDPLGLLARGSRAQGASCGNTLAECWVNGKRVIRNGEIVGCDVKLLRKILADAQNYIHEDGKVLKPESHDVTRRAEKEYRTALGLPIEGETSINEFERKEYEFPQDRTLFDTKLGK
jgi:5-methylthioadenosine/S-adenosylhomocysteine deaminase